MKIRFSFGDRPQFARAAYLAGWMILLTALALSSYIVADLFFFDYPAITETATHEIHRVREIQGGYILEIAGAGDQGVRKVWEPACRQAGGR